jgi:hypothetical protein
MSNLTEFLRNNEEKGQIRRENVFFGFSESPFRTKYDRRFYFLCQSRILILLDILRQYEMKYLRMVVVGKKGTGKTSLAQILTEQLIHDGAVTMKYYAPDNISGQEATLRIFMAALQLEWQANFDQSFQYLKEYFIHQAEIQKPIFLIMETNGADKPIYADFILYELIQLRYAEQPVFHLVWFTTEESLNMTNLISPLIEAVEKITDLTLHEMIGMIRYRCWVAGRGESPFSRSALKQIYLLTHGNPRQTICLCSLVLSETFNDKEPLCGAKQVYNAWHRWVAGFEIYLV